MAKTWLITGCSKGLGNALAEQILQTTQDLVVVTARNIKTIEAYEKTYPNRVLCLELDVTDFSQGQRVVTSAVERFGRIDVLVNNAGYGVLGAFEECRAEDINCCFQTNVFGLMELTRAALPIMRKQKSGCIINVSSVAGLVSQAGAGVYNSTKFAVEGFSEALAQEVAPFGIKVIILEPGPFRTDFTGASLVLSKPISDYESGPGTQMRTYVKEVHGKQPGSPVKAADIMIQLASMETPPLRMPLGRMAIERIFQKRTQDEKELAQVRNLALSADYQED